MTEDHCLWLVAGSSLRMTALGGSLVRPPSRKRGCLMPFLDRHDGPRGERWFLKTDVGLRRLARQPGPFWGRGGPVRFEVLDHFGHVTVLEEVGRDGGDPHRAFYAAPADDRLVDRKAPTDLASVPSIMWGIVASYGDHTMPALLHDTLCTRAERATPQQRSSSAPRGRPAVPHDAQGRGRCRHRHALADVGGRAALRLQDRRRPRRRAGSQPHRSSHSAPRLPAGVAPLCLGGGCLGGRAGRGRRQCLVRGPGVQRPGAGRAGRRLAHRRDRGPAPRAGARPDGDHPRGHAAP